MKLKGKWGPRWTLLEYTRNGLLSSFSLEKLVSNITTRCRTQEQDRLSCGNVYQFCLGRLISFNSVYCNTFRWKINISLMHKRVELLLQDEFRKPVIHEALWMYKKYFHSRQQYVDAVSIKWYPNDYLGGQDIRRIFHIMASCSFRVRLVS